MHRDARARKILMLIRTCHRRTQIRIALAHTHVNDIANQIYLGHIPHNFHCALKFCLPRMNSRTHESYSRRSRHPKKSSEKFAIALIYTTIDCSMYISLIKHFACWLCSVDQRDGALRSNNRTPFIRTSFLLGNDMPTNELLIKTINFIY